MKSIDLFFRIIFVLFFLVGILVAKPASALSLEAMESVDKGFSPEEFLNPDGTLNLKGDFSGTLDLEGWSVNMDPQRGPIFTHTDYVPVPASLITGDWENLDGGVPMTFNGAVYAAVKMNDDIVVGGSFINLADNPEMDYIAKWDGVNWSALGNNGAGNGALNNAVYALAADGSGNLYVGGAFLDVNNKGIVLSAADYIAKWDGVNWSALGSNGAGNGSLNYYVYALAVDGSGNLYVGCQAPIFHTNDK